MAGPLFTMARSAEPVTSVATESELFDRSGSAVVDVTAAVLDSVAGCAGAVTTMVIGGALAPAARLGSVQVTDTFPEFEHVQLAAVTDTNVTPAGSVSTMETATAAEGPALATSTW